MRYRRVDATQFGKLVGQRLAVTPWCMAPAAFGDPGRTGFAATVDVALVEFGGRPATAVVCRSTEARGQGRACPRVIEPAAMMVLMVHARVLCVWRPLNCASDSTGWRGCTRFCCRSARLTGAISVFGYCRGTPAEISAYDGHVSSRSHGEPCTCACGMWARRQTLSLVLVDATGSPGPARTRRVVLRFGRVASGALPQPGGADRGGEDRAHRPRFRPQASRGHDSQPAGHHPRHTEGTVLRVRPKPMTGGTTLARLTPLRWATWSGADVMKRIAAPWWAGCCWAYS